MNHERVDNGLPENMIIAVNYLGHRRETIEQKINTLHQQESKGLLSPILRKIQKNSLKNLTDEQQHIRAAILFIVAGNLQPATEIISNDLYDLVAEYDKAVRKVRLFDKAVKFKQEGKEAFQALNVLNPYLADYIKNQPLFKHFLDISS